MTTRKNVHTVLAFVVAPAVCLAVAALAAAPAGAAIIAEDGFDVSGSPSNYNAGADLNGQNPPRTGFTGAWFNDAAGNNDSDAGGLAVAANGTVGAVGATGGTNGHFVTDANGGFITRSISAAGTGTASELWLRWLWDPGDNNNGTDQEFLSIYVTGGVGRISARIDPSASDLFILRASPVTGGITEDTTPAISLSGGAHLVVIHVAIDRTAGIADDVLAWIDPDSFSDLASLSNPDQSITGLNIFEGAGALVSYEFDFNDVGARFDEFAVSATLSDVLTALTPVPEPSTFALAALGLLGLGCVAWRRRRIAGCHCWLVQQWDTSFDDPFKIPDQT